MSKPVSTRIDEPTDEVLKKYMQKYRYTKSQAVRIILEDWAKTQSDAQPMEIKKVGEHQEEAT